MYIFTVLFQSINNPPARSLNVPIKMLLNPSPGEGPIFFKCLFYICEKVVHRLKYFSCCQESSFYPLHLPSHINKEAITNRTKPLSSPLKVQILCFKYTVIIPLAFPFNGCTECEEVM